MVKTMLVGFAVCLVLAVMIYVPIVLIVLVSSGGSIQNWESDHQKHEWMARCTSAREFLPEAGIREERLAGHSEEELRCPPFIGHECAHYKPSGHE
jgi:hypothetical protein